MRSPKHILWYIAAAMFVMLASCIDNDIPYPIVVANIVEFEVDGQVGEAQINTETRTVSFEVADTIDLQHMRITKFKLNKEAHPAAVGVGSIISCVDSIELMLETYQVYRWVLRSKQQFNPSVRLKGQQGEAKFDGDTIRVYVRNIAKTAIEELRLAAGIPSYSIDLSTISDFTQPIDIDVTTYGRTKHYVLVVSVLPGAIAGPSIVEFELDGQVGAAQINAAKRSVSVELPETANLQHLSLTKLTLSEDDATASIAVGDEISCVDSLDFSLTDADGETYLWKLYTKQQFTPVVRLKGQLGSHIMAKDTIKVYVSSISKTAIEELRLAPAASNPTYNPDPASITDFKQPIDIDVTVYGKTKHYVLAVSALSGMAEGPSIVEFEIDGQVGEAQINAAKRTVNVELPETADLLHLRLAKLTLSEADATASVSVGSVLACVDSLAITLTDADGNYEWKLLVKQQFTPVVQFKGQLGGFTISNNIISLFVDDVATTYVEELTLAPAAGNPTYNPDPFSITDFTQPVDIDVTAYGKTTRYTLNVGGLTGYPCDNPVISITTGAAMPGIITASIEAAITACSAVQPYFEYREQGATDWTATLPGHVKAGATAYTATLDGLKPNTTYEYRAVAGDKQGDTRTFRTDPDPIVSLTTGDASPDVRTATLNANVVCSGTVQVYFEYREQGLPDWQQTATSNIGAGAATHTATIDGLEPATIYEYRIAATSLAGTKYGETLTFTTGEEVVSSISTGAAEPWAKFAHVSAEAMCNQASVALGFEYSKQGTGNWIPSTTKASTIGSNTYTITLTGLEPNTTYEYRAVAGGLTGESKSFTTDGAPTVPNLNFDDWDDNQKNGGRISWRPWSGGNTTTFWNTGNSGVTPGGLSGPGKQSNNTPTTDAKSGNAAMLKSIKLGALASTFGGVGFAAGSIFSGDYATNTSNPPTSVKMGHAYTGRPTQLKGWYKYSPQNINEVNSKFYNGGSISGSDKMHIYIYLLDWSNRSNKYVDAYEGIFKYVKQNRMIVNEPPVYEAPPLKNGKKLPAEELVAYGEFLSDQTVSSYTQFTINLEYYSTTKRPTHIIICATSSYLGSAFTGGENSTLWVDEFELGFDYVEP